MDHGRCRMDPDPNFVSHFAPPSLPPRVFVPQIPSPKDLNHSLRVWKHSCHPMEQGWHSLGGDKLEEESGKQGDQIPSGSTQISADGEHHTQLPGLHPGTNSHAGRMEQQLPVQTRSLSHIKQHFHCSPSP